MGPTCDRPVMLRGTATRRGPALPHGWWRRLLSASRVLVLLLLPVGNTAAADHPPSTRYRIEAEWRREHTSQDGRYTLTVAARRVAGASSTDGRFALKAASGPAAGCSLDPLFSDGFEQP